MDALAGFSLTKKRQGLAMPPEPFAAEYSLTSEAAPVRRLPIGAEPQSDGGVHFRVWAPRCREVVVEIEGLEPEALRSDAGRLLFAVEPAGASWHALSLPSRSR